MSVTGTVPDAGTRTCHSPTGYFTSSTPGPTNCQPGPTCFTEPLRRTSTACSSDATRRIPATAARIRSERMAMPRNWIRFIEMIERRRSGWVRLPSLRCAPVRVNRAAVGEAAIGHYNEAMPRGTSATPSIAIIVLTWNGRELTLDCLRSLEAVATPGAHAILVDNASRDGTVAAVRERYDDRITIIENTANVGFAAGNNVGIRRALEDGADFILLLNNDTIV